MVLRVTKYSELDERKLMDVYSESNYENTDFFFPDEKDKEKAVAMVEESYLGYLKEEYFTLPSATYWILLKDGKYKSALRTCETEERLFYLEALETPPEERGKGYGSELLKEVIETLKKEGSFRLCDTVGRNNTPSLKVHQKCGFIVVAENGYDYLNKEIDERCYGLEYSYKKE